MSVAGFNWLLPQCFDLCTYHILYQNNVLELNVREYVLSKLLNVMNIYWTIISYCLGITTMY